MSERIQLLKQQAGIDFNPDQEGLDQFAELIIKECVSVAWFAEQYGINGDMAVSAQIQKHFGVKR